VLARRRVGLRRHQRRYGRVSPCIREDDFSAGVTIFAVFSWCFERTSGSSAISAARSDARCFFISCISDLPLVLMVVSMKFRGSTPFAIIILPFWWISSG
jgi:hypothetical protein